MLVYTYITPNSLERQVRIDLADYPFVHRWKNYFQNIFQRVPNLSFYFSGILYNCYKPIDVCVPLILDKLKGNFSYFQDLGLEDFSDEIYELNFLIKNTIALNQMHLNKWHRHFTRLEMTHLKVAASELPDGVEYDIMWRHVQDINMYTHKLEPQTYSGLLRRRPYHNMEQVSIQHTNAHNIQFAPMIHSEENIEWIDDCTFDFQTQDYNFSVWLHEEITGKDQFKTWLDHDDLTQYDCTGNRIMTPSIVLDPNMIYASVINTEQFRKESIASGKSLNRYPLGNLVDAETFNLKELEQSKIIKIELDNSVLLDNA